VVLKVGEIDGVGFVAGGVLGFCATVARTVPKIKKVRIIFCKEIPASRARHRTPEKMVNGFVP
jgi:hypothetical protein